MTGVPVAWRDSILQRELSRQLQEVHEAEIGVEVTAVVDVATRFTKLLVNVHKDF